MFDPKAYARAWYQKHREKVLAKHREYRNTHKEEQKLRVAAWHETNRDRLLTKGHAYYQLHKEEYRNSHRKWLQANPEKNRAYVQRRRARKIGATCTATTEHERAIKAAYKNRCAYCNRKTKKLTIDHVVPLAKNGGHVPENLVPACLSCNSSKQDREPVSLPAIRLLL